MTLFMTSFLCPIMLYKTIMRYHPHSIGPDKRCKMFDLSIWTIYPLLNSVPILHITKIIIWGKTNYKSLSEIFFMWPLNTVLLPGGLNSRFFQWVKHLIKSNTGELRGALVTQQYVCVYTSTKNRRSYTHTCCFSHSKIDDR